MLGKLIEKSRPFVFVDVSHGLQLAKTKQLGKL